MTMSQTTNNLVDKKKIKKDGLPEKQFSIRNSLLIDLFEDDHIRTIYHCFLAMFFALFVNGTISEYLKNGEIIPGIKIICIGFKGFQWTILGWSTTFLVTCATYYFFLIWARHRLSFKNNTEAKSWDNMWIRILLTYYISSLIITTYYCFSLEVGPFSKAVVVIELTRFFMKTHAFARSNAEKVIQFKPHSEQELSLPTFSYFFYFLFVPTLVYKDEYPSTKKIRWDFVLFRALEVIAEIFCITFVYSKLFLPTLEEIGTRKFKMSELILIIFESTLLGWLVTLLTFFLILHSWQNFFAELTKFGDRMFYKDWWTCTTYADYFRKWNVIVHDWLYTYVYKDMLEIVHANKVTSKFVVFIISAIFHEWILTCTCGFFFPLLFLEFFIGILLNFLNLPKNAVLNVFYLYSLALGSGSLISLYIIELVVRGKFPHENPTIKDYFVPRLLTSNFIDFE